MKKHSVDPDRARRADGPGRRGDECHRRRAPCRYEDDPGLPGAAEGSGSATLQRCDEAAFAAAMTTTDADAAARAINGANNAEIGGSTIAMFLLGLGLVLTIGGIYTARRRPGAA